MTGLSKSIMPKIRHVDQRQLAKPRLDDRPRLFLRSLSPARVDGGLRRKAVGAVDLAPFPGGARTGLGDGMLIAHWRPGPRRLVSVSCHLGTVEKSVPVRLLVMGEQVFHLGPQCFVAAAGIAQPFPTLGDGHARGCVEQFADLAPALGLHQPLPPRSWP